MNTQTISSGETFLIPYMAIMKLQFLFVSYCVRKPILRNIAKKKIKHRVMSLFDPEHIFI